MTYCWDSLGDLTEALSQQERIKKRPALVWNHGGQHLAGITFGNPSVA